MGQIQSIDELISMLLRHRLMIAAIVCFGVIVSLMVGLSQVKVYETGSVIQVESPVVDGGDTTAGAQSARVLQAIEQRLTTRENLTAIIERHGLFSDAPGMSLDQKIAALRSSVSFQSVAATGQQSFGAPASVSALIIVTRFGDGDQAARVANDFAQSVLDLSTARQTQRARDTLQFFMAEDNRISMQIVALEAELATFKNRNAAALPSARDTGSEEIAALEVEMRRIDQTLVAVNGEKAALEKKERLRETDRRQLEDLGAQMEVLGAQKAALAEQSDSLAAAAAKTPEVERELSSFDRRLQQLQTQYDLITARKAEAETALRLEEQQHSEHFTLLERAMVPEYPVGGGGKKIAMMGTVASVGFAVGLAFLLDLLKPVVRSAAQMERQLGIRPVITIPELTLHPLRGDALPDRIRALVASIMGKSRDKLRGLTG